MPMTFSSSMFPQHWPQASSWHLRDPLPVLGASLFLSILHNLPLHSLHAAELVCQSWRSVALGASSSIYKRLCTQAGVDSRSAGSGNLAVPGDISASVDVTGNPPVEVDWHARLKQHCLLQNAWSWGRCKDRWICPPKTPVWRFKVDEEEGTIICSSRQQPGTPFLPWRFELMRQAA